MVITDYVTMINTILNFISNNNITYLVLHYDNNLYYKRNI